MLRRDPAKIWLWLIQNLKAVRHDDVLLNTSCLCVSIIWTIFCASNMARTSEHASSVLCWCRSVDRKLLHRAERKYLQWISDWYESLDE